MALTTAYTTALLSGAGAAEATHVSLHTADPGSTGASEITTGGTTRQALTWGTPSGGSVPASPVTFTVDSVTVTHVGLWAADGVTFLGGGATDTEETFGGPGELDAVVTLALT